MPLIDCKRIRTDGGTQHRVRPDQDVIDEYTALLLDGDKLPPVKVVYDGTDFWLWDGFHTLAAHYAAGMKGVSVEITKGTHRDAVWLSLSANKTHGLRRSVDDKRNSVKSALQDEQFAKLSDRDIAAHIGVSHTFVAQMRNPKEKVVPAPKAAAAAIPTPPVENGNVASPSTSENGDSDHEEPGEQEPEPEGGVAARRDQQTSGPTRIIKPKVEPIGDVAKLVRERDLLAEKLDALVIVCEELQSENAVYVAGIDMNDQLKASQEECKKLREQLRVTEEQLRGAMEEKNVALRLVKGYQRRSQGEKKATKR